MPSPAEYAEQARFDARMAEREELRTLRAEVERLTRERDEARARARAEMQNEMDLAKVTVRTQNDALVKSARDNERLRAALDVARQMRAAQRGYFKHRTQMALTDSKRLEQALDRLLASEPGLFDA